MRVSKVKVKANNNDRDEKMVIMNRTAQGAALVFNDDAQKEPRTDEILPDKKRDSFKLSITNKTLIKRDRLKNIRDRTEREQKQKEYDTLKNILDRNSLPAGITEEEIKPFLNHKFQSEIHYYAGEEKRSFDLTKLILNAVKNRNADALKPYRDWEEWHIITKSEFLKKSVN
jgi:hypothetical protein